MHRRPSPDTVYCAGCGSRCGGCRAAIHGTKVASIPCRRFNPRTGRTMSRSHRRCPVTCQKRSL